MYSLLHSVEHGAVVASVCVCILTPLLCLALGAEKSKDLLSRLWAALVPDAVRFVRKGVKEAVPSVDNALVMSCFNIMDALLKPYVR